MGTGKRGGLSVGRSDAPSMQTYNIPSKIVEGQKWIMGLKLDKQSALSTSNKYNTPGAGTYEPNY